MSIWQTWWAVSGPRLVDSEIRLSNQIVLAPLSDQDFEVMKGVRGPVLSVASSNDACYIQYPQRDEVQSRHRLQIDVEADNSDEAVRLAQTIANKALLSLNVAVSEGPYLAELRKFRKNGEVEEVYASSSCHFVNIEPSRNLTPDNFSSASIVYKSINCDTTAENAYIHLFSAWQLQNTRVTNLLDRSVLLHFVLCIEAIINKVASDIRKIKADAIKLEESKLASEFAKSLINRSEKAKEIRAASTALRNIAYENTIPAIEISANKLGVNEHSKEMAKELYKLRSQRVGHPGRLDDGSIARWLNAGSNFNSICPADEVARGFFLAYCRSIVQSGSWGT